MAKYKRTHSDMILREDGMYIPPDLANYDFRDYLAWLKEGNSPDPADPDPAKAEMQKETG